MKGKEAGEKTWSVWRQDDHGNVFTVRRCLTEAEALSLIGQFEKEGHKQTYWGREDLPADRRRGA